MGYIWFAGLALGSYHAEKRPCRRSGYYEELVRFRDKSGTDFRVAHPPTIRKLSGARSLANTFQRPVDAGPQAGRNSGTDRTRR